MRRKVAGCAKVYLQSFKPIHDFLLVIGLEQGDSDKVPCEGTHKKAVNGPLKFKLRRDR
jgi:hypothetical protein